MRCSAGFQTCATPDLKVCTTYWRDADLQVCTTHCCAEGKSAVRRRSRQHREPLAVGSTLPFLNPGNRFEAAVRCDHERLRFGVPLLRHEGGAKEALRLRDAPIACRIQLLARA